MKRYNIYAGLGGSFGGTTYQYTTDCKDYNEAEDLAYQAAIEEYESYEGLYVKSWYECAEEYCEEEGISMDEIEDYNDVIDQIYIEERDGWIDFYAKLTDEDTLDPEELDLRWCVEDGSSSQTDSE